MTSAAVRPLHDRPPVTTSSVPPVVRLPKGRVAHERAVEALLDSYRRIPAGAGVRLAKRTSNLFRPRAQAAGPGLDVAALDGVVSIDTAARTADVQGMCTYENLVAATLPKGLMPLVVPQLRTITLGGAVTGLGIESTSFRNGLPHESVLELDVVTGAGDLVTATPDGEHADLFRGFPNSYGTLGYSVRLRIELEEVAPYVETRNVRFASLDELEAAIGAVVRDGAWDGERVDFLDGVVFSATESYLVLGAWAHDVPSLSDYTGQEIYYRSLRDRGRDALTVHDYLWRWDVDWFWCSKAFGAQNPAVRKVWPASRRRSDVYHRIVGLENRYGVAARIDAWRGKPARERVVQDVEVPVSRTADFLRWFLDHVPMTPVWLCPLRVRDHGGPLGDVPDGARPWSLYPLRAGETYVNIGFWGTVPIEAGRADGDVNRAVEAAVSGFDGHKSLYSDSYYDEPDFWERYGGDAYRPLKERYDPAGRLLDLYAKAVGRR
ncbi:FAD-binding oxidoreductase [Kineosporia sp. R_H_3]|uniref:FAD-binding oxidoreductase n=1 Tax=Kineosporia sp. R_H_3 TaxID=1961848 RepID=UPI000B4BF168|nr:FAD-binding oxidoreductase [Kineosporia sp. R_H_3]